jgi:glutathione peroxidase-family protein|nr:MAG TPA: hypothetical protein [Bacteriophage sp.]
MLKYKSKWFFAVNTASLNKFTLNYKNREHISKRKYVAEKYRDFI